MIERITIAGHASYGIQPEEMNDLRTVNFVYGPNAAGKTTASRIIGGASPKLNQLNHYNMMMGGALNPPKSVADPHRPAPSSLR